MIIEYYCYVLLDITRIEDATAADAYSGLLSGGGTVRLSHHCN